MTRQFETRNVGSADCADKETTGTKSTRYDYVVKSITGDTDYPTDACTPFLHGNMQVDNIQINGNCGNSGVTVFAGASCSLTGTLSANTGSFSVKPFNIPHPTKPGMRLVHACLEGPENGVYIRGRLTNNNIIELPDYWTGLVDQETITVNLTQIGSSQDLIVDRIEWGKRIVVRSANASAIDCYYTVNATRKDVAPLPVEMGQNEKWPYDP
jgi:hypothetical protein